MKFKKVIILSIFPLLTSCSGFPISRSDALNIVSNIEKEIANYNVKAYTVTSKTTSGDNKTTIVSIYSKESKYYHTYSIYTQSNGRVTESWKFVMSYQYDLNEKETTTADFIFDVQRRLNPNNVDKEVAPQYIVTYEKYSEEAWRKYADDYENSLIRRHTDSLEHCRSLIKNEENEIDLKSFNGNSLFLNCKQKVLATTSQVSEYEINFSNNEITWIKNVTNQTNYSETTINYDSGDINYPAFKVTIV